MQDLILSPISIRDFKEVLSGCIREELSNFTNKPIPPLEDFITENEAVKLLQVSKVTLSKWRKDKKIPFYRLGTRIRYKRQELIDSAQLPKKYGRIAL